MTSFKQVTCLKCGWVAFDVTRAYAESEVASFSVFFDSLDTEGKAMYGNRKSGIGMYEHCQFCNGSYKNFREWQEGDCPDGVTLSPIIRKED